MARFRNIQRRIADILSWDCFCQADQLEDKANVEAGYSFSATAYLEDSAVTEGAGEQYGTQLMCQNLANNSFSEYEKLYYHTPLLDVYMFAARSNAIHYANKSKESKQPE